MTTTTQDAVIRKQRCKVCGHEWYPRTPGQPARCAKKTCNSPNWNRDELRPQGRPRKQHNFTGAVLQGATA